MKYEGETWEKLELCDKCFENMTLKTVQSDDVIIQNENLSILTSSEVLLFFLFLLVTFFTPPCQSFIESRRGQ